MARRLFVRGCNARQPPTSSQRRCLGEDVSIVPAMHGLHESGPLVCTFVNAVSLVFVVDEHFLSGAIVEPTNVLDFVGSSVTSTFISRVLMLGTTTSIITTSYCITSQDM